MILLYCAVWVVQYWPLILITIGLFVGICVLAAFAGVYFS